MEEKIIKPSSGYLAFFILLTLIIVVVTAGITQESIPTVLPIALILITIFTLPGFFIVNPNGSKVLTLFGKYVGTVKSDGFYWMLPFYVKKSISLRARNFDSEVAKVNDKKGNPIMISVILVWRVKNTYKAAFDVDDYQMFVKVQTDAAVRKMANMYAYDNFDNEHEVTLRSGMDEVNDSLEVELDDRLAIAGIEVIEARIGYLAYAQEIASAMLKRQQAEAIVAARYKIVEGAVGMVESALDQLSEKHIVDLDEDKKATMVSNLLVVLCGEKDVSPVVNTGSIY